MSACAQGVRRQVGVNIWACVRRLFRDATESRIARSACSTNPAQGVPGPDKPETDRAKQMLYPDEFAALIACKAVPIERRRLYAAALFTAMRQAEIRALEWGDVDIAHRVIAVTKSEDVIRKRGVVSTKAGKVRETTIETVLVPLFEAMHKASKGQGRVFPKMPRPNAGRNDGLAVLLRRDLKTAGVERSALFADTPTSMSLRFHDLRASGITWRLARGDNPMVVRQETGHADAEVQQLYVRRLREVAGAQLFPTLDALLSEPTGPGIGPIGLQVLEITERGTGFEPVSAGSRPALVPDE